VNDQAQEKAIRRRHRRRGRRGRRDPSAQGGGEPRPPQQVQPRPQPPREKPKEKEKEPEPERELGPREIPTAFPILLGGDQATEEQFEEEIFAGDWEPQRGYVRTVDVMTSPMRGIILADAGDYTLVGGEEVVLSTEKGIETARAVMPAQWRRVSGPELKVKILRVVGHSDVRQMSRNKAKEMSAYDTCRNLIARLRLDMKLLRAQYLHGGGRVIFYFTARQRVDFRQLVKELHAALHVRVELKQIGVRDAVKMEGGIGPCGLQACCNRFLYAFKPVSVRMVKEQNMMMNPQKISGLCGRLLCCLEYEHRGYRERFYGLPSVGQRVKTPEGEGQVVDLKIIEEQIKVQIADGSTRWWKASELNFAPPSKETAVKEEEAVDEDLGAE
jgi:cell fate regulator YaaT (PSP1 superfamily)